MEDQYVVFAKDLDIRVHGITVRYLGLDSSNFYFLYYDDEGEKRTSIDRRYFAKKGNTAPIGDLDFSLEIYQDKSILVRCLGHRPGQLSELEETVVETKSHAQPNL